MTYFEIDVKTKVIDMEISVPTKLEPLELDLPGGSYEFLKYRNSVGLKGGNLQ